MSKSQGLAYLENFVARYPSSRHALLNLIASVNPVTGIIATGADLWQQICDDRGMVEEARAGNPLAFLTPSEYREAEEWLNSQPEEPQWLVDRMDQAYQDQDYTPTEEL